MAKLKPIHFEFKPKAGEVFRFISEATVSDSTGMFNLTIPDELEGVAKTIFRSHGTLYGVELDRPRTHLRVVGSTLEGCKNFIKHVGDDHVRCEVTEELVIVYGVHNKVTYVKDCDGKIYANGYEAGERYKKGDGEWCGTLNGSGEASKFYQVGFAARAAKKTTFTRPSGVTSVFSRIGNARDDSWLAKLNGFVGLSMRFEDMGSMDHMAYSEDAAKFFYNVMLAMCQLADRIDNFFGDQGAVLLAIEKQAPLLAFKQAA